MSVTNSVSNLMRRLSPGRNYAVIARDTGVELCYTNGYFGEDDAHYTLVTEDGLFATLGSTGLIQAVYAYDDSGMSPLFLRDNAYGNFQVHEESIPSIEYVMDRVYETILGLEFDQNAKYKDLFEWRAQQIIERFGDFSELYGDGDILPEYRDEMTVVSVSKGCPRKCSGCPSGGGIELYNEDTIKANMELARRYQVKHHGKSLGLMDEGFINGSDILWHHLRKGGVDPVKIVEMYREHFPEVAKLYAFMGTPTVLGTELKYLQELYAAGLNRILFGYETGHDATSRFIGKNETAAKKAEALRKLQAVSLDSVYKFKTIVQVGMVGEGFYDDDGTFVSSREGLEATVEELSKVLRSIRRIRPDGRSGYPSLIDVPDKVLISRYVPVPGSKLAKLHEEGKVIKPYSSSTGLEDDVRWLTRELRKRGIRVEDHYEHAIQRPVQIITGTKVA